MGSGYRAIGSALVTVIFSDEGGKIFDYIFDGAFSDLAESLDNFIEENGD